MPEDVSRINKVSVIEVWSVTVNESFFRIWQKCRWMVSWTLNCVCSFCAGETWSSAFVELKFAAIFRLFFRWSSLIVVSRTDNEENLFSEDEDECSTHCTTQFDDQHRTVFAKWSVDEYWRSVKSNRDRLLFDVAVEEDNEEYSDGIDDNGTNGDDGDERVRDVWYIHWHYLNLRWTRNRYRVLD